MKAPMALLLVALAGCGAADLTYEDATLEDVLRHRAPTRDERYRIDKPSIPVARGNTGIIREGSAFAILVGPDLKGVLKRWPADVQYGVRLVREPRIHLVLERVFAGNEQVDLLEGQGNFRFHFPRLADASEIPMQDFEPLPPADLRAVGKSALLTDVPLGQETPAPAVAAALGGLAGAGRLDRPRYFVGPPESRFLVTSGDPMTLLMLDFLRSEKRGLSGGVTLVHLLPEKDRGPAGLAGAIDVRWIHLGGAMYFVAP
jgi:hypothetical protein